MKELIRSFSTLAAIGDQRAHATAVLASRPPKGVDESDKRNRAAMTIKALDDALEVLADHSGRAVALAFIEWHLSGQRRFDPRTPSTNITQETSRTERIRRPGRAHG